MPRRLLVLSESFRRTRTPDPVPALERYSGVFFEVLKKAMRETPKKTQDLDIIVLTGRGELFSSNDRVPYHPPVGGRFSSPRKNVDVSKANDVQSKLRNLIENRQYSEVFVNAGAAYRLLLGAFDMGLKAKVIYAKGYGLGPKAGEMKRWILGEKSLYT